MNSSYSALGRWFENLNDDCGYEQWSQYLIKKLKLLGAGKRGVDIGCGNGYFTRALIRSGYDMLGVDISPAMLSRAQELSFKEGVRTEFLLGDITKLKLSSKRDFAIAVNDCLNYVKGSELERAFNRVRACLKKGGVFIFDVSSAEKLRNVIGDNLFAEDGEDITYIWFNALKSDSVVMDLTFFERGKDGKYSRFDERHVQYIHEEEDVIKALERCGFSVESEGHLGKDKRDRINFICKSL